MQEWIPRLFGVEVILSAVSAFGRPDYNLPLFIFAFMIWDYPKVFAIKFEIVLTYKNHISVAVFNPYRYYILVVLGHFVAL